MNWLIEHHGAAARAALGADYFGLLEEGLRARIRELPRAIQEMIRINASEWLLAQAELTLPDGPRVRVPELILGRGGPFLTRYQRAYLTTLAVSPFALYGVRESRANAGIILKNLLEERAPDAWVTERSVPAGLAQWHTIGTQLVFVDGWQLCGGIYPFRAEHGALVRKKFLEMLRVELAGAMWHSRPANDLLVRMVIAAWLTLLAVRRRVPRVPQS